MKEPRLVVLTCVEQLRKAAAMWDDLWWRSDATTPTVRAEMVAQWVEQFSPQAEFRALVVTEQNRWVAALPLVPRPDCGLLSVGRLTSNEWSPNGDLLVDPRAAQGAVFDTLAAGMQDLPWRLLWCNEVLVGSPRWQSLRHALDRSGMLSDYHGQMHVGVVEVHGSWGAFRQSLSKHHRRKMTRCNRRLAEMGDVRVEVFGKLHEGRTEPKLRTAFEIEDRSWKGPAGTSVLRSPGMFEFFVRQARQLADWGHLELAFLYCGSDPIAFSYGYTAKGVSHWHKIGYDPQYSSCTPGQLLQWHLLKRCHTEKEHRFVDTLGPVTEALSRWNPAVRRVGRLMIAPRGSIVRPILGVCLRGASLWRRLRRPSV